MWDSILKNKYSNSIQFIKPHRVDDFFFIRDSIKESSNKYSKYNTLYSKADDSLALVYQKKLPKFDYYLCSILPLIFSYKHSSHKIDIYAIVNSNIFTSNFRDPHSIYGDIGYISLYKRVNNRWILIKIIDKWNAIDGK